MIATSTPVPLKTCAGCGERRPVAQFRLRCRASGKRHTLCKTCWSSYQRDYRARRAQGALDDFTRQLAAATDTGQVTALVKIMVRRFGGLRRLARFWHRQSLMYAALRPGSAGVLRQFWAMIRLLQTASDVEAGQ